MNTDKMIKTAKTLDTFVKVAGGIFKAFGFVCLIFFVLVLILGEKMISGSLSLSSDFLKISLSPEYQIPGSHIKIYALLALVSLAVVCFMTHFACLYLRAILNPIKDGRPFEADIPIYIRRIAWLSLIGGAITRLIGIAERLIMLRTLPLDDVFSSPAIENVELSITFDFGFVWLFVALMFLSYIFSYGQSLQKQADETL